MMLARRIFCSVKYYNLILVSASHLQEEAKINPSTISWELRAMQTAQGRSHGGGR